jgi:hypothetical protein
MTKQACKLERFVALPPRGQKPGLLQRIRRADFPVDPVEGALFVFAHDPE